MIEELLRNKKYFLYIGIGEHYIKKDEYFISLLFSNEDYEIPYEALYSGSGVNWYFSINEEKKLIDSIKEIVPWASLYKGNEPYTDNLIKDQIVKSYRELKLYDKNEISKAENNSLLRLSCWLTGEWSFRADLKANKLAKSFKTLNDFLKKESGIIKD